MFSNLKILCGRHLMLIYFVYNNPNSKITCFGLFFTLFYYLIQLSLLFKPVFIFDYNSLRYFTISFCSDLTLNHVKKQIHLKKPALPVSHGANRLDSRGEMLVIYIFLHLSGKKSQHGPNGMVPLPKSSPLHLSECFF